MHPDGKSPKKYISLNLTLKCMTNSCEFNMFLSTLNSTKPDRIKIFRYMCVYIHVD